MHTIHEISGGIAIIPRLPRGIVELVEDSIPNVTVHDFSSSTRVYSWGQANANKHLISQTVEVADSQGCEVAVLSHDGVLGKDHNTSLQQTSV